MLLLFSCYIGKSPKELDPPGFNNKNDSESFASSNPGTQSPTTPSGKADDTDELKAIWYRDSRLTEKITVFRMLALTLANITLIATSQGIMKSFGEIDFENISPDYAFADDRSKFAVDLALSDGHLFAAFDRVGLFRAPSIDEPWTLVYQNSSGKIPDDGVIKIATRQTDLYLLTRFGSLVKSVLPGTNWTFVTQIGSPQEPCLDLKFSNEAVPRLFILTDKQLYFLKEVSPDTYSAEAFPLDYTFPSKPNAIYFIEDDIFLLHQGGEIATGKIDDFKLSLIYTINQMNFDIQGTVPLLAIHKNKDTRYILAGGANSLYFAINPAFLTNILSPEDQASFSMLNVFDIAWDGDDVLIAASTGIFFSKRWW